MSENMKKMRLKLEDLKIQSFVTTLSDAERQKIKGGAPIISNNGDPCDTYPACPPFTIRSECAPC
jgi:hypothetical protein